MTSCNDRSRFLSGHLAYDGFDFGYCLDGEGKPLLIVGSSIYYPRTFSADLRRHRRLCFIDHRGFARCRRAVAASDGDLATVVEDIERLRLHLGLGKVDVLGHSGHGYIALAYAAAHPEAVEHVVVVATGPSHAAEHMSALEDRWQAVAEPERHRRFEADIASLAGDIAAEPERRFVHMCLRMGARSWFDPAYDARPLWAGVATHMTVFDRLWGETFRDIDTSALLGTITAPILLALGRHDYLVAPAETWERYRPLARDLTTQLFEQSAHTPQLEESALFDAALRAFLNR